MVHRGFRTRISNYIIYMNREFQQKFQKKNCELDEEILTEAKLPPWMELETIYYFDDKEILGDAKALKDIPMKYLAYIIMPFMENRECLGVIVKDMSKSKDKGFTFKV